MIDRKTAKVSGLLGLVLSASYLAGDVGSRLIVDSLTPGAPQHQHIITNRTCEVVNYDSITETSTLYCQRSFEIDGNKVAFGPKYIKTCYAPKQEPPPSALFLPGFL